MPQGTTQSSINSSTSPSGALASIANTAIPKGTYKVVAQWALTGTAETSLTNLRLTVNAVNVASLPTLSGAGICTFEWYGQLDGVNVCRLATGAAATTGAIYTTLISATRLSD